MANVLAERIKSSKAKNDTKTSLKEEVEELKSKLDRQQIVKATSKFYDTLRALKAQNISPDVKEFQDFYDTIKIEILRPIVYGGF